jgi:hypothetical protein
MIDRPEVACRARRPHGRASVASGHWRAVALVGFIAGGAPAVWAQGQPEPVTSDTPEYCLRLRDKVNGMIRGASATPAAEVLSLATEGEQMCTHGQTRGGLLRLRRALLLLQGHRPG